MAVLKVGPPAAQDGIGLGHDGPQAQAIGAPRQRSQFLLQLLEAFLPRPFVAPAKRPAQEVEAFSARVDYARFDRMQGEPRFARPLAEIVQHRLRFGCRRAEYDKIIRVAHHFHPPLATAWSSGLR